MKPNFESDTHFFGGLRYCCLIKSEKLDKLVALALQLKMLAHLRKEGETAAPSHDFFVPGQKAVTGLGDAALRQSESFESQIRDVLEACCQSDDLQDITKVDQVVKRRFSDRCAVLSKALSGSTAIAESVARSSLRDGKLENPFVCTSIHDKALRQVTLVEAAAESRYTDLEVEARQVEEKLCLQMQAASQRLQNLGRSRSETVGTPRSAIPNSLAAAAGMALATFLLFFSLLSFSAATSFSGAAIVALASFVWFIVSSRLSGASTDETTGQPDPAIIALKRSLYAPVKAELYRLYELKELAHIHKLEAGLARGAADEIRREPLAMQVETLAPKTARVEDRLARQWSQAPAGYVHEQDPGFIELLGRKLAEACVNDELARHNIGKATALVLSRFEKEEDRPFGQVLLEATEDQFLKAWTAAAIEESRQYDLGDAIDLMLRITEARQTLEVHLESLKELACAVARLRPDVRVDSMISPANLWIGLPQGPADRHADMLKQLFHLKNVEHSFRENAIELVYEIRNLSNRELLVQELNRSAYISVHPGERDLLYHFPFSVKAPDGEQDPVSRDRQEREERNRQKGGRTESPAGKVPVPMHSSNGSRASFDERGSF